MCATGSTPVRGWLTGIPPTTIDAQVGVWLAGDQLQVAKSPSTDPDKARGRSCVSWAAHVPDETLAKLLSPEQLFRLWVRQSCLSRRRLGTRSWDHDKSLRSNKNCTPKSVTGIRRSHDQFTPASCAPASRLSHPTGRVPAIYAKRRVRNQCRTPSVQFHASPAAWKQASDTSDRRCAMTSGSNSQFSHTAPERGHSKCRDPGSSPPTTDSFFEFHRKPVECEQHGRVHAHLSPLTGS